MLNGTMGLGRRAKYEAEEAMTGKTIQRKEAGIHYLHRLPHLFKGDAIPGGLTENEELRVLSRNLPKRTFDNKISISNQ
jgi:hypothetical protein